MAEANNVEMQSGIENEDQLLLSDGGNAPHENAATPPREIEDQHRRIRRMNRRERQNNEMACNRCRERRVQEYSRRHRSPSRRREHLNDRDHHRTSRSDVATHQEERFPLRRSKISIPRGLAWRLTLHFFTDLLHLA